MPRNDAPLREHLSRALSWESAHLGLEDAAKGLPPRLRGRRPKGFTHSPWELLEHIRLAQRDLLDFCRDPDYVEGDWPAAYWPKTTGTAFSPRLEAEPRGRRGRPRGVPGVREVHAGSIRRDPGLQGKNRSQVRASRDRPHGLSRGTAPDGPEAPEGAELAPPQRPPKISSKKTCIAFQERRAAGSL